MKEKHALAASAALIAEPARSAMLVALLDGRALTAGELARAADVSPQSASLHLSKLLAGGMIRVHAQGRHRYYRMAGPEVGFVLEALGTIATMKPPRPSLRTPHDEAICFARTCYDHLAGRLAVELALVMERDAVIIAKDERDYELGPDAASWLARIGVGSDVHQTDRRHFARRCMDWTERRPHVGGALGASVLRSLLDRGWIKPRRSTRALRVTDAGLRGLSAIGLQVHTDTASRREAGSSR